MKLGKVDGYMAEGEFFGKLQVVLKGKSMPGLILEANQLLIRLNQIESDLITLLKTEDNKLSDQEAKSMVTAILNGLNECGQKLSK